MSAFTNQTKNTATPTSNQTKTSYVIGAILTESGFFLVREQGDKILRESATSSLYAIFTNLAKT